LSPIGFSQLYYYVVMARAIQENEDITTHTLQLLIVDKIPTTKRGCTFRSSWKLEAGTLVYYTSVRVLISTPNVD
jgi:hypothetical protein